jgi:hypothetical protein
VYNNLGFYSFVDYWFLVHTLHKVLRIPWTGGLTRMGFVSPFFCFALLLLEWKLEGRADGCFNFPVRFRFACAQISFAVFPTDLYVLDVFF